MRLEERKKALVLLLSLCFAVVIASSAYARHSAAALGFASLGIFVLALYGVPDSLKLRVPIFGLGILAAIVAAVVVWKAGVA